jgi:hypothetical protein
MIKFDILERVKAENTLRLLRKEGYFPTFKNTRSYKVRLHEITLTKSGLHYVVHKSKESFYFPTTYKNSCTLIKNYKGKGFIQKPLVKKVS